MHVLGAVVNENREKVVSRGVNIHGRKQDVLV